MSGGFLATGEAVHFTDPAIGMRHFPLIVGISDFPDNGISLLSKECSQPSAS